MRSPPGVFAPVIGLEGRHFKLRPRRRARLFLAAGSGRIQDANDNRNCRDKKQPHDFPILQLAPVGSKTRIADILTRPEYQDEADEQNQ